ncbi:putative RNA-directed DNA polymerase [Helianthus annuus]|nr:putative RNA-directed DNA polymerase [Helianthus annuus]
MTWAYFFKKQSRSLRKIYHVLCYDSNSIPNSNPSIRQWGEFVNTSMKQFFKTKGLIHQTSCSHTPEQSSVSEQKNRIILGVLFKANGHLNVELYTDADWAEDKGNRRSTSGYFSLVGGNLVTWRSKKQKVVSLSSGRSVECIARGLSEVLWIRKLLEDIGFSQKATPSKIMCDNTATIQISENPVQHDRTKHVEVDRHFIKEKLEERIIELPYISTKDQLADILIKAVNGNAFSSCLSKLSIGDPTTQLEGECWKEGNR